MRVCENVCGPALAFEVRVVSSTPTDCSAVRLDLHFSNLSVTRDATS